MPRIDWVEQRLQNWARWVLMQGSGALGFARVNLEDADMPREPWAEAPIPTNDVEASDTEEAVRKLNPPGLALTVREFYLGRGGIKDKCRRLCCGESTVYARIDQAHRQLADLLLADQQRRKSERARVEALQASVRPRGSFTT